MAPHSSSHADTPAPFRLTIEHSTLVLEGEFDIAALPAFEDHLNDALTRLDSVVTCDLSHLSFIDATGLSALIAAERRLRDEEKLLVLRAPQPFVKRVLDITGLTFLLESPASGVRVVRQNEIATERRHTGQDEDK